MEFSDRFICEMTRPFYFAQSTYCNPRLESNLTLDSNNVFNKSLLQILQEMILKYLQLPE